LLHMVTADSLRTPTFTMFGDPDYYFQTYGSPLVVESPGYAWNHGDVQPEITTTWLGMVGPGVKHQGMNSNIWSDHTDIRPTMMMLLGLKDDYSHEGRALVEDLRDWTVPATAQGTSFHELASVYKKIDAPVGELSLDSLKISTKAMESKSTGDKAYTGLENKLVTFTTQRDALKSQIINLLEGAEFGNQPISANQTSTLLHQSYDLLGQIQYLAATL